RCSPARLWTVPRLDCGQTRLPRAGSSATKLGFVGEGIAADTVIGRGFFSFFSGSAGLMAWPYGIEQTIQRQSPTSNPKGSLTDPLSTLLSVGCYCFALNCFS